MAHKCIACSVSVSVRRLTHLRGRGVLRARLIGRPGEVKTRSTRLIAMATHIDAEKIEHELQQRLSSRMDSVRELVKSRQKVADARDALSAAEDEDARRYQTALTAGWTAAELRSAGLSEPEKKLRVRKRATRRSTPTPASSEPTEQPLHRG